MTFSIASAFNCQRPRPCLARSSRSRVCRSMSTPAWIAIATSLSFSAAPQHLAAVEEGFADVAIQHLRLFDEEMVGLKRLRTVGQELFGDRDPTDRFSAGRPFRVEDVGEDVVLVVGVPFAERADVDVMRHGNELVLTVGPYRRSIILPDSLGLRATLQEWRKKAVTAPQYDSAPVVRCFIGSAPATKSLPVSEPSWRR